MRKTVTHITIGGLAEKTGTGVRAIRYYESLGLLPIAARTEGGYRVYDDEAASRLGFIVKAKSIGLKLREIKGITELMDKGLVPCGFTKSLIKEKINETDIKLEEFSTLRSKLVSLLELCEQNPEITGTCPVIESLEKKP